MNLNQTTKTITNLTDTYTIYELVTSFFVQVVKFIFLNTY